MFAEEEVSESMKNVTDPASEKGIYLYYITYTLGWICTTAWSLSFYPQIFINWKRKSVVGLSFDFIAFNFVGFLVYSVYIISLLWIPLIKTENEAGHSDHIDSVHVSDAVFSLHALLLVLITLVQCIVHERGDQKVSEWTRVILVVLAIVVVVSLIVPAAASDRSSWTWLRSINALSYIKVVVTVLKYWPQVLLNYRRKSTDGWSVHNVILDFVGGWLSLIQMFIDATASGSGNWPSSFQNIVKYWLCVITLVFDSIFLMQHYALYARKTRHYRPLDQRLNGVLDTPEAENGSVEDTRDINLARGSRRAPQDNRSAPPSEQNGERHAAPSINQSGLAHAAPSINQNGPVHAAPSINQHDLAPSGSRYPPPNYGAIARHTTRSAGDVGETPSSDARTTEVNQPSGGNNCIHGPGHPCHQARAVSVQNLADDVPINTPTDNVEGNDESGSRSILNSGNGGNYGTLYPIGAINTSSDVTAPQPADNRESEIHHERTQEETERLQKEYQDLGIHFNMSRN